VFGFGPGEMMIVFIIVLLIFGPSQLPKLAKGLGNAMREFRKAQHEISDELNRDPAETKPDAPHKPADAGPPDNKPIQ
jgi:sec-independent protein translocase protein TatA